MSPLGHQRTCRPRNPTSVLPLEADIAPGPALVRKVPITEVRVPIRSLRPLALGPMGEYPSQELVRSPDHALAVGTIGSGWNFEASCDFGGGPEPCFMGPVRGGENRFAYEKQAAVHRSGQDRAESETSRPGVRVGSAREAVVTSPRNIDRSRDAA